MKSISRIFLCKIPGDPPSWTQNKTANLAAATCSAHFPRLSAFSTISAEKLRIIKLFLWYLFNDF